jgi:SAM-dependent methyltransferase
VNAESTVPTAAPPVSPRAAAPEWGDYVEDFDFLAFDTTARVVDVGCGAGDQLAGLARRGVRGVGVDRNVASLAECRRRGFPAIRAVGEALPLRTDSVDGVICKVTIPYTHERAVLAEIARVLRGGGIARCAYIGAGYYLRYLFRGSSWKVRLYGLRTLVNTWVFVASGRRHARGVGDTLYQSRRRLARYYAENALACVEDRPSKRFCGFPVFIYQTLRRAEAERGAAW